MPKPFTVLLVDDDADWRMLLRDVLQAELEDVEVLEAASGFDALKVLSGAKQDRPDLVCADVNMPGMSGMELLRSIKTSRALRSIPVVVITGQEDMLSQEVAICSGASAYTKKTSDPNSLVTKILRPLGCRSR